MFDLGLYHFRFAHFCWQSVGFRSNLLLQTKKINEVKFMHENKEFKLYVEILNYSRYIRKYVLVGIPNVHRDLRIHLMKYYRSYGSYYGYLKKSHENPFVRHS